MITSHPEVVVDCAGAAMGGAARFLRELDLWMDGQSARPTVIGREEPLTARWLLQRERLAPGDVKRIALNNVSFFSGGGERIVLLRNALHFVTAKELASLGYEPPRSLRAQIPIVRRAARRADRIVVPCHAMAERVVSFIPTVADRLRVRPHPVTPRDWAGAAPDDRDLLVPILNAPYKRLSWHLTNILRALRQTNDVRRIYVTANSDEFPRHLTRDRRLFFVGRLNSAQLDHLWERTVAVYFPTQLESFGYPLAEARANGRRVVAADTAQNHEIAGAALAAFVPGDISSLGAALVDAMSNPVPPDPSAFAPAPYFSWLTGLGHE